MERSTRPASTRVLLVSPLPPPMGGMQTWTETLLRRGLPEPFAVDLVNTRQTGRRRKRPGPRLSYARRRGSSRFCGASTLPSVRAVTRSST